MYTQRITDSLFGNWITVPGTVAKSTDIKLSYSRRHLAIPPERAFWPFWL